MVMQGTKQLSSQMVFGGQLMKYQHDSACCKSPMKFNIFVPPSPSSDYKFPVMLYLSGLTCTEDNFMQKAGVFQSAVTRKIVVVAPDTSPRGLNIDGESESWDFGVGASYYIDATEKRFAQYQMYTYVSKELPDFIFQTFSNLDKDRLSICGHSMGGHGALMVALRNPGMLKCVSAFAPISHLSACQWGQKALAGYLGNDLAGDHRDWDKYDCTSLAKSYSGPKIDVLIHQGSNDTFLEQLRPQDFVEACAISKNIELKYNLCAGYDHGYYFVATFIADHVNWHADHLYA